MFDVAAKRGNERPCSVGAGRWRYARRRDYAARHLAGSGGLRGAGPVFFKLDEMPERDAREEGDADENEAFHLSVRAPNAQQSRL